MAEIKNLTCRECGRDYDVAPIHVCEFCFGPLEAAYDYEAIDRDCSREQIAAGPRWQLIARPIAATDTVLLGRIWAASARTAGPSSPKSPANRHYGLSVDSRK